MGRSICNCPNILYFENHFEVRLIHCWQFIAQLGKYIPGKEYENFADIIQWATQQKEQVTKKIVLRVTEMTFINQKKYWK